MSINVKHWQDPISLIAGIWLAASPWVLAYQVETRPAFNAVIAGVLIALIAFYALYEVFAWQEWANLLLGVWLSVSPWVLGFSAMQTVMLNTVIVGALVAAMAFWTLATDRDIGGWFSAAH